MMLHFLSAHDNNLSKNDKSHSAAVMLLHPLFDDGLACMRENLTLHRRTVGGLGNMKAMVSRR